MMKKALCVWFIVLCLSACGGGGGSAAADVTGITGVSTTSGVSVVTTKN